MLSLPSMTHRKLSLFKILLENMSENTVNIFALNFKELLSFEINTEILKRMSFVKTHGLDLLIKETRQ